MPNNTPSKTVEAYECGSCKKVYLDKDFADSCCTCSGCGIPWDSYGVCKTCRAKHEEESLAKAEIVATSCDDVPGCVDDNYFFDDGTLQDFFKDNDSEIPDFIWACKPTPFPHTDVVDFVQGIVDDWYEDAFYTVNGIDELQKAFDAFYEVNKELKAWYPTHNQKIDLRGLRLQIEGERAVEQMQ